jgi:hypothetical protein
LSNSLSFVTMHADDRCLVGQCVPSLNENFAEIGTADTLASFNRDPAVA